MKSGVVVSLDSNDFGSVSVVVDACVKKSAALAKAHFTNPKEVITKKGGENLFYLVALFFVSFILQLAKLVHQIVDPSERPYTGYTVVISGTLVTQERNAILQQRTATAKKDQEEEPNAKPQQGDDVSWFAKLRGELRSLHSAYRILCSTDCEWDAVEGASRALSPLETVRSEKIALPPRTLEIDSVTMKPLEEKSASTSVVPGSIPAHQKKTAKK